MLKFKNKIKFIKILIYLFTLLLFPPEIYPQVCYNLLVDSIISKVTVQSIRGLLRELSGDTSAIIGGQKYTIASRCSGEESHDKATQYIYEKFQSFGYNPFYQRYSSGTNVIAVKIGTRFPERQYFICAHYDDMPEGPLAPGADDNGSGTVSVLEAARILKDLDFDCTIIFAAWDDEEWGCLGSTFYVDSAYGCGDSILGVIDLDMMAYDSNNDNKYDIETFPASISVSKMLLSANYTYSVGFKPEILLMSGNCWGSDHCPFIKKGYKAVFVFQDHDDSNPYYHTVNETAAHLNFPYFKGILKTAIAALVVYANDYIINFDHISIQSNADTSARIASAVITSNNQIGGGPNSPKLYYKVGNGSFTCLNSFYHHQDTFKYLIPGQLLGSTVSYYFAAQDSLGTMIGSLPSGARGVNPPGAVPPQQLLIYRILRQTNFCSNTSPKNILPKQMVFDTILVSQTGNLHDYDLNLTIYHTNDSDLYLWLMRPGQTQLQLSTGNGGSGENYFNTTFDDEASVPITGGAPPFSGSYRPEEYLSRYDSLSTQGYWILRVWNNSQTITGQLSNWCLNFYHYDPISISNNQTPVNISLSQNYPNPFNSSTKINFSLPKQSHVKISIYDVLGREVNVIVNNLLNYGDHDLSFDANNLSSGLYFYSMLIDGKLFDTKKMVLVK